MTNASNLPNALHHGADDTDPALRSLGEAGEINNPLAHLMQGLNPPQAEAVQHTEGPLLILAGAGTGKTSVLTRRLAFIIRTQAAWPSQILAVTFTNKAAREMAERTAHLIGQPTTGMWLGTFHRLGLRMLQPHAERAGLRPGFTIIDGDDQQRLLTQLLKDMNLDTTQFPARMAASVISKWQDEGYLPAAVPTSQHEALGGHGVKLYTEYLRRLAALNVVDFGNLLLYPLELLKTHTDIREKYQNQFKYILVDEYQDTNAVQYQWLKILAAGHSNLCVVGDDDQSIYAWRGAQVGNILNFTKDYPTANTIRLEQNYRSTGHILAAANAVIANNRNRHDKALWTDVGDGTPVEVHPLLDDREEARMLADQAHAHQRNGGTFSQLAILVRTAAQTRAIEEQFIRSGLPYVIVGGLRFYERKEIKDALAYLRLIHNTTDDLAFARIVNVPKRGVGETSMAGIESTARATTSGLEVTTGILLERGEITGKAATGLRSLMAQLQQWRMLAQMESPDRLAERVLEDSGYLAMLRDDKAEGADEAKSRLDNLKELIRALQDYADLGSFLEHVALVMDADTETDDSIKMTTVHAAKGLEFPIVFIPGFEEGLFPHQRSLNEEGVKGLEEERRLAYVAFTRAKQRLVITHTAARRLYGQYLPGIPSRFLKEIPGQHLRTMASTAPSNAFSPYGTFQQPFGARPTHGSTLDRKGSYSTPFIATPKAVGSTPKTFNIPGITTAAQLASQGADTHTFAIGQRIRHAKFGLGRIAGVEGSGADLKYHINFDTAGTKRLLASLANLQTP